MLKLLAKMIVTFGLCYLGWNFFERMRVGYGPIGLLIPCMFLVHLYPRDLMNIVSWIKRRAYHSAVFQWHGKYYSFDGHQIRFYLIEQVVWMPLVDVERILEPKLQAHEISMLGNACQSIPEHSMRGLTEEALMRLLVTRTEGGHTNYKMIRFKRWLLTSALDNVKRLPKSAIKNLR
ncbi:hypothetical protein [Undibacterium fentianense]|uniref:Uncharacterized protein n=1 Tax=Undibacterium fentianense TaxID=2828728 RepID=A0A941IF67_9BURK|nr:hypothetical protein [Undibacterium fentianense]MBR7800072.1 hypothetical protein [Undibacterium fentianense]